VIREELGRLFRWEDHHRRLFARIGIASAVTLVVDLVGGTLMTILEKGLRGSDIHNFGEGLFFSTVQLLTVSSQMANPVTTGGRIVDVFLELWALVVVTAVAGSFAAFFRSTDSS
jgi:hypothetical protein